MVAFKKAERKQAKLKIALTGPSGSGKTFSALCLATGIGSKIAVIDTENGSASLYADRFEFDTLDLSPPYTIPKYIEAIKSAEAAGYDVILIDSISHAWAGDGGLLSKKEALDARGGNSFANWGGISKEHEQFKAILLSCGKHLIVTMRSKQDYVLEVNEKGKSTPRKVGLAPIQREGMEYEFTTVFDIAMDHNASASKDRTSIFDGNIFKITKDTGKVLMNWLSSAKSENAATDATQPVQETPAAEPAQTQPKAIEPKAPPKMSGVSCKVCASELTLHKTGQGYLCPNSKANGDGHTRFAVSKLSEFQKLNPVVQTAS